MTRKEGTGARRYPDDVTYLEGLGEEGAAVDRACEGGEVRSRGGRDARHPAARGQARPRADRHQPPENALGFRRRGGVTGNETPDWPLAWQPRIERSLANRRLKGDTFILYGMSSSYPQARSIRSGPRRRRCRTVRATRFHFRRRRPGAVPRFRDPGHRPGPGCRHVSDRFRPPEPAAEPLKR